LAAAKKGRVALSSSRLLKTGAFAPVFFNSSSQKLENQKEKEALTGREIAVSTDRINC